MRAASNTTNDPDVVVVGSEEDAIIAEELELLAEVQRTLADREIHTVIAGEYDRELLSLRDQIAEARTEDVAPLVAEMYRLQAVGARAGEGRSLPVDASCPYFGHLVLEEGDRQRHVLVGNSGFVPVKGRARFAIVDWRNAPVSRVYYRYEEGEDYEEDFGGRVSTGEVLARRTITIQNGELRRIIWSRGAVARRGDGTWIRLSVGRRPTLEGGAGTAARPPNVSGAPKRYNKGKLGVVGDESLREDKRLQAITGLIDKAQFDLITKPDSGIVILQGGAGSGKTTVALHRAAYLHYQNPQVFSAKKMLVVVRSPALTEYIARILPSLGVPGMQVITLEDWMRRTRQRVLPQLDRPLAEDVPYAVARLKKHPAIMKLLESSVEEEAEGIRLEMEGKAATTGQQKALGAKWRGLERLALVPRIREMARWVEGAAAARAGLTPKITKVVTGVLRRARGPAADVESTWAMLLTDRALLRDAFEVHDPDVSDADIRELVAWVGQQADEVEVFEDEDDSRDTRDELRAEDLRRSGGRHRADEDGAMRGMGIDGRHVEDESARGCFDEHDDALLLRLVQLKMGSLPLPNTQKTLAYEHIVVDEAQDLSPTDVAVLRGALTKRESMTLAGDTAQKLVFDNSFSDWKTLMADLGISGTEIEPLRISYRSTREVMALAQHVLGPLADPVEPVATRSGAPVEQFNFGTTGESMAFLGESLRSLALRERRASVAVIARYAAQANLYYQGLRNAEVPALRRVYGKEFSFAPGIDVVDVAQIKGLEYDYVVLVEVNRDSYPEGMQARHLLHIASTRAVYQLWVTSVGTPSPLLPPGPA